MIGLGKWQATVSALMFKFTGTVEIKDNNGQYEFIYDMPEKFKNVKVRYYDVREIGNDTLTGKGELSIMPGKVVTVQATFTETTVTGFVQFAGMTAKITNGKKIQ